MAKPCRFSTNWWSTQVQVQYKDEARKIDEETFTHIFYNCFGIFAKAQEYKFNVFTQEQGLPQPYVYDLVQDKRGFLYIATGDGLALYGGKKMVKYTRRRIVWPKVIAVALFLDSKLKLWVGHFEGHVSKRTNGKFKKLHTNEEALARVVGFAEDSKGYIYFANAAGGLYVVKEDGEPKLFTEELPPINEIKIKEDKLYTATQEGVLIFELGKSSKASKTLEGTQGKNTTCIEISSRNELWVGEDGIGVELLSRNIIINSI